MEEEKPVAAPNENNPEIETKVDLDKFREYLIGLHNHYGPYHERKEQMVWAATTIYMTGIFAVIISMINNFENIKIPILSKIGFVMLLMATAILLCSFIYKEFKNRQFAAEMIRVIGELLTKLNNPRFEVSSQEIEDEKYQSEINEVTYVFPKIFCDYLNNENKISVKKFPIPYMPFYILIGIWTLAVVILIFNLPFKCVCP